MGADGKPDFEKGTPVVSRTKPAQGEWVQDPDVLDTWFSSGLWPFSTLGWPAQTEELKTFYPNSVMETGHDIIFFWVARMMMMGLHFMGEVPFRTVYLHAMVRDEKGEKMSKTKGNVIDPLDIIQGAAAANLPGSIRNKYPQGLPAMGADALRFTLASQTQQGRDIKLSIDRIGGYKAFCNKIWNAARFALMNMGEFEDDGSTFIKERSLSLADRWILSRLNRVTVTTEKALGEYQFAEAASVLYQFLWGEFCDWYIELSKSALYGTDEHAKDSTRAVLAFVLEQVLRLLHPFMPFLTEEIWQKLPVKRATESICVAAYPKEDARLHDASAEAEMGPLTQAIDGIRAIRGESNLSPALKIEAQIQSANAQVRESLDRWRSYVMPLTGLSQLTVQPLSSLKPQQAAADIRADMEIYVPLAGIVDLAEERERLKKEITKAEQEIAGINKKFSNPNFAARAPAEVVEKDRARVTELTGRIQKLNESSERIAPVELRIAPPSAPRAGSVNLGEELKAELDEVHVASGPDAQVTEALEKLREGTKEGLTSRDHTDLGVAYMSMGLVDDAVREFNAAKTGKPKTKSKPKAAPKKAAKQAVKKAAPKAKVSKAAAKKTKAQAKASKAPAKRKGKR